MRATMYGMALNCAVAGCFAWALFVSDVSPMQGAYAPILATILSAFLSGVLIGAAGRQ